MFKHLSCFLHDSLSLDLTVVTCVMVFDEISYANFSCSQQRQ